MKRNEGLIGKFVNRYLFSDINPVGKIEGIKGKSTIILNPVDVVKDEEFKPNYIVGGFAAHCDNQDEQKWIFNVNESKTFEMRVSNEMLKQYRIDDKPRKFYDYNF